MANRRRKGGSSDRFSLLGLQKHHCALWLQPWYQETTASRQISDDKPRRCIEKQRHYTTDKGPYSQGYGLPSGHVWLWELDHKEDRTQKNWCFRTMVLERLLKVLWPARSNQSILREINPEFSLEILMLKLKLQYFGCLMRTDDSLENPLMLGKIEGRRRGRQRIRGLDGITNAMRLDGITNAMKKNLGKLWEMVRDREAWRVAVHWVIKSQTWLGDWTKTTRFAIAFFPMSKCFLISWLKSLSAVILEPKKIMSFKPTFSLSS